jgi:hypothetical protein
VWLLDLHSFLGPIDDDVCLGDAHATSCSAATREAFHAAFTRHRFSTAINAPYSGGYTVRRYGAPPRVEAPFSARPVLRVDARRDEDSGGRAFGVGGVPPACCPAPLRPGPIRSPKGFFGCAR